MNVKKILFVLAAFFVLVGFTACTIDLTDGAKGTAGTGGYTYDDDNSGSDSQSGSGSQTGSGSGTEETETPKQKFEQLLTSANRGWGNIQYQVNFKTDGTYEVFDNMYSSKIAEGTWRVYEDGTSVALSPSNGGLINISKRDSTHLQAPAGTYGTLIKNY